MIVAAEVIHDDEAWLERQVLAPRTKAAYRRWVRELVNELATGLGCENPVVNVDADPIAAYARFLETSGRRGGRDLAVLSGALDWKAVETLRRHGVPDAAEDLDRFKQCVRAAHQLRRRPFRPFGPVSVPTSASTASNTTPGSRATPMPGA